jgi:hypothetical protein
MAMTSLAKLVDVKIGQLVDFEYHFVVEPKREHFSLLTDEEWDAKKNSLKVDYPSVLLHFDGEVNEPLTYFFPDIDHDDILKDYVGGRPFDCACHEKLFFVLGIRSDDDIKKRFRDIHNMLT